MVKRVDTLTAEQKAQMAPHAQRWIDIGLSTEPADFDAFERHARRCYEAAGIEWPGVVVRVQSPLAMALAGPAAAVTIELIKRGQVDGGAVDGAVHEAVSVAVHEAVSVAVSVAVDGAVGVAVGDAVRGAVGGAVGEAVRDAVGGAVDDAVGDAVRGAVRGAVDDAVGEAVRDAVGGAVDGAVSDAVRGAVRGAVDDAVRGAVRGAVDDAVGEAVRDAVGGAVGSVVDGAVSDAVRGANGAVDGAVGEAVRRCWYRYLGAGRWWLYWSAWSGFFRDVCGLELSGDLWERAAAFEGTQQIAWAWWPHERFVVVCDRPSEIHREQVGEPGWGSHRLHCETGPAVAFRDGWAVWAINGVQVNERIVMRPETLTVNDFWAEPNTEVRRVIAERIGWDRFVDEAKLTLVHTEPDPGNPGETIALYDLPEQVYGEPVRVALVTNASPERDGTRKRYGLTVPATVDTGVGAMAWTFGVDEADYRALARAT
jgi:hypothetical protein